MTNEWIYGSLVVLGSWLGARGLSCPRVLNAFTAFSSCFPSMFLMRFRHTRQRFSVGQKDFASESTSICNGLDCTSKSHPCSRRVALIFFDHLVNLSVEGKKLYPWTSWQMLGL